jgi:hypothetical protein
MSRPADRPGRRWAVLAGVALVALIAGAALRGSTSRPPPSRTPRPVAVPDGSAGEGSLEGPGPGETVDGVGVGFARSEAGAVAAAVSYAAAPQSWLYLSDEQVTASAQAVTLPSARDELVPRLVEDARLLRDEMRKAAGTVWFVVAPLATRVETYGDTRATVRVWVVRVLSADGVAVPQSGWQTLTFALEWAEGDWRIATVDETDGPTPQLEAGLQPWAADYLADELTGFRRVGAS